MSTTDIAAIPLTMSTLEIAGLTGKRHPDVLRDARKMFTELGVATFEHFCAKVPSHGGRPSEVMNLPKRECLILVSGYSVELRARIIDRWMQLEAALVAAPAFDLTEEIRAVIGGIVKAVVHKELTAVLPGMVENALEADARAVAVGFKPALTVLTEKKVPARKRRAV